MAVTSQAIGYSFKNLGGFIIIFGFIICGFAQVLPQESVNVSYVLTRCVQAGVISFGNDIGTLLQKESTGGVTCVVWSAAEFRDFTNSFFTLLRTLLGDFDFEALEYSVSNDTVLHPSPSFFFICSHDSVCRTARLDQSSSWYVAAPVHFIAF